MDRFTVKVNWDAAASVWYVEETDVPGLVVEDESFDAIVEKIKALAPELLELNKHLLRSRDTGSLPIHVMAEQLLEIPRNHH